MFGGLASAQDTAPISTMKALDRYAAGERDVIARHAPDRLPPVWTIADNLAHLPRSTRLSTIGFEESPRAIAAFAVEAARVLETQGASSACTLITVTRARWVAADSKSEFDRRWFAAAIAALLRDACPNELEKTLTAALEAFPTDARFRLARLVAAEQQLTAKFDDGERPSAREIRDAETRFKIAQALPASQAEAALRWSRINARLGQHEDAVALAAQAGKSSDPVVQYLAHLFRGWSLAALGKTADADAAYRQALQIFPGAQTATVALAALSLRNRQAESAERLVDALVSLKEPPDDPWWSYSIGDGRLVDRRILEMRQVIR